MSKFNIRLVQLTKLPHAVLRWCLDFPIAESLVDISQLAQGGILFQGWCVLEPGSNASLYLMDGEKRIPIVLDQRRRDVTQYLSKKAPRLAVSELCGFRFLHSLLNGHFTIGVTVDSEDIAVVEGRVVGPFDVICGEQGWLYLDNDTNKSVDQYTGKCLLSESCLEQWSQYVGYLNTLSSDLLNVATLVAPSKEMIYPQFYPHKKGEMTPVEQLIGLDPDKTVLVYPDNLLRNSKYRSFRKVDTHWTPYGAMLATRAVCARLGLSRQQIKTVFANDKYQKRSSYGDLGNKVYPRICSDELMLTTFKYRKYVVYDNGLLNFGRVIIIDNAKAISKQHLVLFGSSSSYSMFDYLCRLYKTVTFIHTAGNLDPVLLQQLAADVLLTQTNARFVVRAPSFNYRIADVITEKWRQMEVDRKQKTLSVAKTMADKTDLPSVKLLHTLLLEAIH